MPSPPRKPKRTCARRSRPDRKSTRLNPSHVEISYAVFCLKKKKFDEVCWSDAEMYLRAENWAFDGVGLENPQIVDAKVCPYECGLFFLIIPPPPISTLVPYTPLFL